MAHSKPTAKRKQAPLGEHERRLLHSLNGGPPQQLRVPASAPFTAPRHPDVLLPCASPPALPLSLPAPLPARAFYSQACVDDWLRSLSLRSRQRALGPFNDGFATQAESFAWGDTQEHSDRIAFFSREEHATGRRRFGAATPAAFWRNYLLTPAVERHHYELLREDCPVRLFLDLEFCRASNPSLDGQALADTLLELLAAALLQLGVKMQRFIELDSTSETKWSRHIVVHDALFPSAVAAGVFVRSFCAARLDALSVRKADASPTCFVDMGVYTRNRAFRLPYSIKWGKTACMLPTRRCWEAWHARGEAPRPAADLSLPQRWLFVASLVCEIPPDAPLIGGGASPAAPPAATSRHPRVVAGGGAAQPCPFPLIARSVLSAAGALDCGSPHVRTWAAFPEHGLLVLGLGRTRYCQRVGRSHKSNGVFYVVDLRERSFYQKCHDPDCRHYRSPPAALPADACAERCLLDAMAPPAPLEPFAAEDAWLEQLGDAELARLDGDDDSWWAGLQPQDWAALELYTDAT